MTVQGAGDPDWGMRASDKDREAVVTVLRDAYAVGRLTLDEFNGRTSAAYAGRTWGELQALAADLPEVPEIGADLPGTGQPATPALRTRPIATELRKMLLPIRRALVCTSAALVCCAFVVIVVAGLDYGFSRLMFQLFN